MTPIRSTLHPFDMVQTDARYGKTDNRVRAKATEILQKQLDRRDRTPGASAKARIGVAWSKLGRCDQIRPATPIAFSEGQADADKLGDAGTAPLRLPA